MTLERYFSIANGAEDCAALESSTLLQWLSRLSPLSFIHPMLSAWMFGSYGLQYLPTRSGWLLLQTALYGIEAILAFNRRLRSV
jgi:hypothetical protein